MTLPPDHENRLAFKQQEEEENMASNIEIIQHDDIVFFTDKHGSRTRELGSGTFGRAWEVTCSLLLQQHYRGQEQRFAYKEFEEQLRIDEAITREFAIQSRFDHENIVKAICLVQDDNGNLVGFLTELCNYNSLALFLEDIKNEQSWGIVDGQMRWKERSFQRRLIRILLQISLGMEQIHRLGTFLFIFIRWVGMEGELEF